jgi:hypothetical protein
VRAMNKRQFLGLLAKFSTRQKHDPRPEVDHIEIAIEVSVKIEDNKVSNKK